MSDYVIATDREWNHVLVENLDRFFKGKHKFHLITSPSDLAINNVQKYRPPFIFVPHWSNRIGPEIFKKYKCIIFHMTDLPYGRGGSPLQNLIVREFKKTKISAALCVEEFDAGPIFLKKPLSLAGSAGEIYLRARNIIEKMIIEIISEQPKSVPQKGESVVFKRRLSANGDLGVLPSLTKVYDYIRMLDAPQYPHAFLETDIFRFEFSDAQLKGEEVIARVRIRKK